MVNFPAPLAHVTETSVDRKNNVSNAGGKDLSVAGEVANILEKRRSLLPGILREIEACAESGKDLTDLESALSSLAKCVENASYSAELHEAAGFVASAKKDCRRRISALADLRDEFSRETLNLGVSGEARVGKSTTLQGFTGLGDTQIPTGKGLPVTAVRSEIYNDGRNCAEIVFRSVAEFMDDFIAPHLANVNTAYPLTLSIASLDSLRKANLEIKLNADAPTCAADSLHQLKMAQRDIDSFAGLLGGSQETVPLDAIRKYVAYPTDEEAHGVFGKVKTANRAYLAVKGAKIYCPFPGLGDAKVGLVDLPGLGEIGAQVADAHLRGLGSKVDQIVLIAKPTAAEGYFKKGISDNIDNLRSVQPGVARRCDLVSLAVNVEAGAEESAQSLRHDIEDRLNGNLKPEERYQVLEYSAVDGGSVAGLFEELLAKLTSRLPEMDAQKIAHAMGDASEATDFARKLKGIQGLLSRIERTLPRAIDVEYARCQELSAKIIDAYNTYEAELLSVVSQESRAFKDFQADVEHIYVETEAEIKNGLFRGSVDAWEKAALGQADYYNYYRQEGKRLRSFIVDAYCGLDAFYGEHVESFKARVLGILLRSAGNLEPAFGLAAADGEDERIDAVAQKLSDCISCEDALGALDLLRDVDYGFRSNVFLMIEEHLEELANPCETFARKGGAVVNKRIELGSVRNCAEKIAKLHHYLEYDALAANRAIKAALLGNEDRFNQYLYNSLSFYCDHLYRRDVSAFKGVFVRGLVSEYADELFADDETAAANERKRALLDQAQAAIESLSRSAA